MPDHHIKGNSKELYSREFVYDKYLFSVDKFDKYFSYISTGSIPLLLLFTKELLCIRLLCILVASLILYFIVVITNLIIWAISMRIFEKWVEELDNKIVNSSIDKIGGLTYFLTILNIIIFSIATILAGIFITTNIINQ